MLITGATSGIGKFLAEGYSFTERYKVIGCGRRDPIDLGSVRYYQLDVSDEQAVVDMLSDAYSLYGRLDIVIKNAGVASMNHFLTTPISSFDKVFETNVKGTFLVSREAAKLMKSHGGRIVNFTSIAVPFSLTGESVYTASKAAIESLTKVMARELAPLGITVNAVGPCPIATDLLKNVPEDKIDTILSSLAIHEYGMEADVLNVIDFFINPKSNMITGQVIYLGGAF
jgi:3-oxoacyl-[acyl-carrier protein] reductase